MIVGRIKARQLRKTGHGFLEERPASHALFVPWDKIQSVFMIGDANAIRNIRRSAPRTDAPDATVHTTLGRRLNTQAHALHSRYLFAWQIVGQKELMDTLPNFAPKHKHSTPPTLQNLAPALPSAGSER